MIDIVTRWWRRRDLISPRNGWINLAIGGGCAVCVLLGSDLGLGTVGRWYLGYFAVVLLAWGVLAVRLGRVADAARPLRIGGDILGWIGLIGFAVVGLLLDPSEYPALITLAAFFLFAFTGLFVGRWLASGQTTGRSGGKMESWTDGEVTRD